MKILKQSTAAVISFGPMLDKSDGNTLETGLVSALDHVSTGIKLSKAGGALTIRNATVTASTYDSYGNYLVTLDTTDTNTVGRLKIQYADNNTTALPVWDEYFVLPANVYDSLVGSDLLQVDVTQLLGTAWLTPGTAGTPDVNTKLVGGQTASASGTVTFPNATLASTTNITAGTIATVTNKVTPIDVDGITYASALEAILAVLLGKAVPSGSTIAFKKQDGTTTKVSITYGSADGERTASTVS